MRSSNPVFATIERSESYAGSEAASYVGIIGKTLLLFLVAILTGYYAISTATSIEALVPLLIISFIVALISVIVASRSVRLAMPFAFVYALAEGIILGFITYIAEQFAPGIALTAIMGTASIFLVMLFLYTSRTIRVTPRFRKIMISTLLAIFLFFILFMFANLFTGGALSALIGNNYGLMIGISAFLIIYGALMLTLRF
jgi:uncharacterized YccA/Bax inhibitor family protein